MLGYVKVKCNPDIVGQCVFYDLYCLQIRFVFGISSELLYNNTSLAWDSVYLYEKQAVYLSK